MAGDIKIGPDVSAAAGSVGRVAWAEAGSVCHSRISVSLAPYERREPQRSGELAAELPSCTAHILKTPGRLLIP
jgi:hypothetical protein